MNTRVIFGLLSTLAWACAPEGGSSEIKDKGKDNPAEGGGGSSEGGNGNAGEGFGGDFGSGGTGGGPMTCGSPQNPAGAEAVLAPEYAAHYTAYELGPVPGVPDPLGGCAVLYSDENTLLIAGGSESSNGGIYAIGIEREPCGHIIGFTGTAQLVAQTPYVDANLVYGPSDLLLYTGWPVGKLMQLPPMASSPAITTDLAAYGVNMSADSGPGGIGFVPPPLAAAGGLRIVSWPGGNWYHVGLSPSSGLFTVTDTELVTTIPNNPGGFAYVPAGSAGFANQSIIVAEWRTGDPAEDKVATYEVDEQGDPIVSTRKDFFSTFPRPWGAYFEPVTGDYIFLTWGASPPDRVYIVQGFEPPPPPPPPPM